MYLQRLFLGFLIAKKKLKPVRKIDMVLIAAVVGWGVFYTIRIILKMVREAKQSTLPGVEGHITETVEMTDVQQHEQNNQ